MIRDKQLRTAKYRCHIHIYNTEISETENEDVYGPGTF